MDRGFGEVELAQRLVPEGLLPVVEVATRAGDIPTLAAVTAGAVLVLERDRAIHYLGVVVGGFSLLAGLKAAFALSRPPVELHLIETATTGFPSGHAMGATLVFGGLALALEVGSRRARVAAAAVPIAAAPLSRIVLGVHYLVDVVVGIGAAVGFLWAVERYARGDPARTLAVGAGVGLLAVAAGVVFGPTPRTACAGAVCLDRDAAVVGAAALGAFVAWRVVDRRSSSLDPAGRLFGATRTRTLSLVVLVPLLLGALLWVGSALLYVIVAAAVGAAVLVSLAGRGATVLDRFVE